MEERRIQVSGVPLEPRDEAVSPTPRLALSLEDFVLFALRAWPWLPPPLTTDATQPSEQTFHVTSAFYHRLLTSKPGRGSRAEAELDTFPLGRTAGAGVR